MSFALDDHWVWDFWIADTGEQYHLYYLHAPRSLGSEHLRHRNARIGHAVSTDLHTWEDLGPVLGPGGPGAHDESATWTGCVVPGPDGRWRMFYTGARFTSADSATNIETIGVAVSDDLHTWVKVPGATVAADPRYYETLPDRTWREEAWRDPWVHGTPGGSGWHMLITARASGTDPLASGDPLDRGVLGHATSPDLLHWTVRPALSRPGAGFAHIEVPQRITLDGRHAVLFSCDTAHLAGERRARGERGGIWAVPVEEPTGPVPVEKATLLTGEELYSGRAVRAPGGGWALLAFENVGPDGDFTGRIADPRPLAWGPDGQLRVADVREAR
ncbi:glycosyl hydrolase family 32 [Streptomyces bohaiensis]|uniref:beta-fructofuranosidase n=1 Tax=Streptomyces bohaiensis TaxID=1431344 RepID=A0ABX1CBB5_9ACTN|nr:glycosyl hydrolase family 32 [Streptomyces bohaiensis]NJQ14667.1 glycosyl hydrolase family 32 [Streptomyces bohaiensis]